jgi:rubrerythrin
MADTFSPQEILKVAIEIEINGRRLYDALEKKSKDEKVRGVWRYLKEQEEEHRKTFQEMLDNVGDYIVYEFSAGQYQAYIKAIAASYVFTTKLIQRRMLEGFSYDIEAIDCAIQIEKESILTYTALKDYVQSAKQQVLNKVIDEEKKHLVTLNGLKETLVGDGNSSG